MASNKQNRVTPGRGAVGFLLGGGGGGGRMRGMGWGKEIGWRARDRGE